MFRAPLCPSSGVQGCALLRMVFSTLRPVGFLRTYVQYYIAVRNFVHDYDAVVAGYARQM